jgi:CHAT domain-containing protein
VEHPTTAGNLHNLVLLKHTTGDNAAALEKALQLVAAEEHLLGNALAFTSERQRLAYQWQRVSFSLPGTLGDAALMARAVLRQKGIVLDSLLEDRLVANERLGKDGQARLDELRSLRQRVLHLELGSPAGTSSVPVDLWRKQKKQVREQAERLESDLAREVSALGRTRRALSVTVENVQGALPTNAALLEFVRYKHDLSATNGEGRYGVLIVARDVPCKWIDFPSNARDLDGLLATCRSLLRSVGENRSTELETTLRDIYAAVWSPIQAALPSNTRTVILSPDGEFNFLSFATLLNPQGRFLGEDLLVRYVSSGRDLLFAPVRHPSRTLALWAHPQYDAQPGLIEFAAANFEQRRAMSDFRPWEPLPGTLLEATNLLNRAKSFGFEQSFAHLGPEATEAALKQLASPYVLHLATHGFFLSERDGLSSDDKEEGSGWSAGRFMPGEESFSGGALAMAGLLKNPMHRSGLALAGANVTVSNWISGRVPAPENDGVLLADEVVDLNLSGTWLVVLSACETALGESCRGEGVLGLRRAFVQAGAQHLMMTLWPVGDAYTSEFMIGFYQRAMASGDAPTALAELQRKELRRLRSVKDVQAAVQRAGAFVLSSQGN